MYGYSDDYFTGCDYYLVTDNIGKLRHYKHHEMIKNYIGKQEDHSNFLDYKQRGYRDLYEIHFISF